MNVHKSDFMQIQDRGFGVISYLRFKFVETS